MTEEFTAEASAGESAPTLAGEGQADEVASTQSQTPEETSQEVSGEETSVPTQGQTDKQYGTFKDADSLYEGYQNLESKLGDYADVKAKAELYEKIAPILENPEVQKSLTGKSVEDPQEPDMASWTPEQIIDYRAEQKAQALIDKMYKEKIEPLAQDHWSQKADTAIKNVREQFSDFDEHKQAINDYLETHPGLVQDEKTLVDVYKIVTYDKALSAGEKKAIEKMQQKSSASLGQSGTPQSTSMKGKPSLLEAFDRASQQS